MGSLDKNTKNSYCRNSRHIQRNIGTTMINESI